MFVAIEKSSVSNCLRIEVKKSGSLDDVMCELERSRRVWPQKALGQSANDLACTYPGIGTDAIP